MEYKTILTERRGQVGLVTLNRPDVMNALNQTLLIELMDALQAFDNDRSIGAMVITGNEEAFAAGADITEMAEKSMTEMTEGDFTVIFARITHLNKPIIAAVSGWALGGGCEIALSCDMIVASDNAKFGQPEITLGVVPGAGGTQRLTRAVGKAVAMEMILNNRTLSANEALQYGLVNRVFPTGRCLDEAITLAQAISSRAPLAVRLAKKLINLSYERSLSEGLRQERQEFYRLFSTDDQKEGMNAFIEKRKPHWNGK